MRADKTAIVMDDRRMTYGELDEQVTRMAHLLRSALGAGERVAVLLDTCPEYLVTCLAAELAGVDFTPVNVHLTPDEAAYIVNDSNAHVVVTSVGAAGLASMLVDLTPSVRRRLVVGGALAGHQDFAHALATQPTTPLPESEPGRVVVYTSGTTGRPKGIHAERPTTGGPGDWFVPMMTELLGGDQDSVSLTPGPLHHGAPLRWSRATLKLGATLVLLSRFDRRGLLESVQRHRVTHLQLVPAMMQRVLKLSPEARAAYDVSSLRAVMHTAAPCPPQVRAEWIDWVGEKVWDVYTSSEGFGRAIISARESATRPGSVGRPIGCEIHACDESGNELPPRRTGVLWFSGLGGAPTPNRVSYHNAPEKTAALYNQRGWATVGDIGYVDEDGYVYLTDRRSDTVIINGVNVYPREAEDALLAHPAVADVAVIGVPDTMMGERLLAVVEPVDSATPGSELAAELISFCRNKIAAFKCPRNIEFVDRLPRGAEGKLRRRQVRDAHRANGSLSMVISRDEACGCGKHKRAMAK
ncbi:AMP-binding protein [Allokutzneria albata]|uniref:Acyl-CoA synthetase (AMP-forming)/AMP-acid ligase II n=1 Tax=Allokutzneria albata TaxID=211114 RepID=A0A1G9UG64_ALLAB|nr:AMP-binding protein [Allokutzneria albata]SDM58803.1 Acyl-CoA synthetase (AMP-forming)/AMP-acid ligase II [Allokutzneria albata]